MSCLQLHLLCLLCRRLLSAGHRHLSLWLRTKLLGNCTISHLSFLFWQMGFSFFLFFHLKEIPCTCQMYCMKVITEPWRKYLNDALVMCCSDNSSFQSMTTTKKDNKLLFYYENVFMCLYSSFRNTRGICKVSSCQHYQDLFSCKQQNYKIKFVTSCDFTFKSYTYCFVFFFCLNLAFCLPECQTGK